MINLDVSKATIDATMQLVITSSDNPSLSQSFKMNDWMLRYNCVTADVFIDTFFAENTSNSNGLWVYSYLLN